MKILVTIAMLIASVTVSAQTKKAATGSSGGGKSYSRAYGMAGCGLGSAALGKEGNQVLAATTNGTFYSQLFGITSETLNCVDDNVSQVAHRSDVYIHHNKYALQGDIAQGQGETVAAFSKILGCSDNVGLASSLKKNYNQIFNEQNRTANEITDSIITVIQQDEALKTSCQLG